MKNTSLGPGRQSILRFCLYFADIAYNFYLSYLRIESIANLIHTLLSLHMLCYLLLQFVDPTQQKCVALDRYQSR